jgi:type II secretory pathway pseudopilin PulG
MRIVFTMLSLLVVVAVIGILAKKQLGSIAPVSAPAASAAPSGMAAPSGTPQQQVQQFRQAAENAMQQARPMPDEK